MRIWVTLDPKLLFDPRALPPYNYKRLRLYLGLELNADIIDIDLPRGPIGYAFNVRET